MNRDVGAHAVLLGLEVLRLGARGMPDRQVGEQLGISTPAVRSRLKRLYRILGAHNATHAVVIAAIDGLLTREDLRKAYEERRPQNGEGAK